MIHKWPERLHQVVDKAKRVRVIPVVNAKGGMQATGGDRTGHLRPDNSVSIIEKRICAACLRIAAEGGDEQDRPIAPCLRLFIV